MRVLVTGHNGYVGTIMMPLLIAANHEVVGLDTNLYEGSTFGEDPKRDFLEINKDVRDVDCLLYTSPSPRD